MSVVVHSVQCLVQNAWRELWVPLCILFNGQRDSFASGKGAVVNLTIHLHLLPWLKTSTATPLLVLYAFMAKKGTYSHSQKDCALRTYYRCQYFIVRLPWLRFFRVFFLSCKANARVKLAKTGHGPHSSKTFVLFKVLFVLCRSVYCLCVNVYCTTATGWQLNCS